jgi:hypothetical protein
VGFFRVYVLGFPSDPPPQYVSRSGLLDYIELVSSSISSRFTPPPSFHRPLPLVPPPSLPPPVNKCHRAQGGGGGGGGEPSERYCLRCQEIHEVREREGREEEERKKAEKVVKVQTAEELKARMYKRRKKKQGGNN